MALAKGLNELGFDAPCGLDHLSLEVKFAWLIIGRHLDSFPRQYLHACVGAISCWDILRLG